MSPALPSEERILIYAPKGRDAELAAAMLGGAGMTPAVCRDLTDFCAAMTEGAGAGLATEEALGASARACIVEALAAQPLWSDFPLLILAGRPPTALGRKRLAAAVAELGNVTTLDRPLHPEFMLSAMRAALRARRRQYQARELLERLEGAVRERDNFLATLSHELRNPLGAIRNAMQVLARGTAPGSAAARPLAVVDRQTRHLARLVDDLLDVSRVTSGKVTLQRRVTDLRTILQNALHEIEPAMEAHGLALFSSLGSRALPVNGDPVRLEQVFSNLLTNAMKYTPSGGRVTVRSALERDVVRVSIEDTGVGIAPEILPSLFRMFSQADRSLDRAQGGMGIGLMLVRSLVTLHGGTVSAHSAGPGQGAEFVVRLPLVESTSTEADQPANDIQAPAPARHILLVEDNRDNRESLQELLQQEGHRVDVAADGPQGVDRALVLHPDVAIIDIGLPGMDGFEVARRVRAALGPGIVLVALTGYGQPEDRRKTAEAGFNEHVTKPAGLSELAAILARLERRRTRPN